MLMVCVLPCSPINVLAISIDHISFVLIKIDVVNHV